MTQEYWTILDILSTALFDYSKSLPSDIDWTALYEESVKQAVFPLVYSVVQDRIPTYLKEQWDDDFYQYIAANMLVNYEHAELHKLMGEKGIPYVILKGAASESYYPNQQLRAMGDVDFIVSPKNIAMACKALESAGFVCTENNEHEAHLAYHREPDSVWELHWSLAGIPKGKAGDNINKLFDNMIATAHMGDYAMLPDDLHHCIVMLVHTAVHLTNTGIGLRHFCDWAVYVNQIPDFEKSFKEILKDCGLWRFAQLLTQASAKYLHMPAQAWSMEDVDDKLLEAMMSDIFESGNFGDKDSERINQAKLMTDMKSGHIDGKSMPLKIISVMNNKSRKALPVCNKSALLLPIGWLYVGTRHLIRIFKGKRPSIHAGKMIKGAQKRRKIYKEFHLYEIKY